ncbi:MAG TPA: hypothetical protein VF077_07160, partial [Nitrospiraceae bacterium]
MPGTNVILPGASPGIDSRSRITPKYDTRGRFIVEDFEGPNRTLAQMFPLQVGTTASIDTQQAKFGGQSIRITQTGTASSSKVQASKQVKSAMAIVGRFWFRLDNLPGVLIQILNIGSGINGLIQITSGSLFSSGFTGSVQSGAQPTTKVWHAVDYRIDYRDHTMLFDAMIDGVANTQATIANNATSMGVDDFNFANSGATTVTYWIDGWQQSDSIRDYPLSDDPSWVPFVDPTKWQKPHFMFKQIMFDVPLVFPEFAPAPTVGPTDYIDSDTVILLLVPSAVETADLVDLDTVLMSLTPSATEIYGRTDADTVTMSLVPSATEVEAAVDSATVNLALTPSQSETEQAVDSATIGLSLVPSAAEIMQSVDSATIPITLTPSAT